MGTGGPRTPQCAGGLGGEGGGSPRGCVYEEFEAAVVQRADIIPTPAGATHPADMWEGPQRPQRRDRPHRGDEHSPCGLKRMEYIYLSIYIAQLEGFSCAPQ